MDFFYDDDDNDYDVARRTDDPLMQFAQGEAAYHLRVEQSTGNWLLSSCQLILTARQADHLDFCASDENALASEQPTL